MIGYVATFVFCLAGNPSDCQTVLSIASRHMETCEGRKQSWAERWLQRHPEYELKSALPCEGREQP
jgi:hypothetical protein